MTDDLRRRASTAKWPNIKNRLPRDLQNYAGAYSLGVCDGISLADEQTKKLKAEVAELKSDIARIYDAQNG